jgi:hypothetical protein
MNDVPSAIAKQPPEANKFANDSANTIGTPDPFDLTGLRLDPSFVENAGVKKLLTTIPVGKPNPQDFGRVRQGEDYRETFAMIELKEDREHYVLHREIARELSGEFFMATLFVYINRQGVLRLVPVKLPGPDGRVNKWHRSLMDGVEAAMHHWVRIKANMALGAYDDQTTLEIAADQQFLNQKPRHDSLAGAGIIGEQESQWLTRKHFAVNGCDLVGQGFDLGGTDGEIRIKKISKSDAVSLGCQPQQAAVCVERVASSSFQKLEAVFLPAIDKALADPAIHPKHEIQGVWAETGDLNDFRDPCGIQAEQSNTRLDIFKLLHPICPAKASRSATPPRRGRR